MFPLDAEVDQLRSLFNVLERDGRLLAVAVAAPYKAEVATILGERLSPAARRCGSINLFSRDLAGGLVGINTDGVAALESLKETCGELSDLKMLILGCGGTGRAVISTLLDEVQAAQITVSVRDSKHSSWLTALGINHCRFSFSEVDIASFDVVVNCTTLGWGEHSDESPLSESEVAQLSDTCLVFDVVYQPDPTLLLRLAQQRGLRILSGTRMNLLQAAIAFKTAARVNDLKRVERAMTSSITRARLP